MRMTPIMSCEKSYELVVAERAGSGGCVQSPLVR